MTRRQYWICYYGNIYYITDAVQTTQLDLIGSIISKLAKLVCGNHWGVSFYIFDTSILVVVATPDVLKSWLPLCLQGICVWGQPAVHHWVF